MRAPIIVSAVAVAVAVACVLSVTGCTPAESHAPPPPEGAELRSLVSRASGFGPSGYARFGVTIDHFITDGDWPVVMTRCVRSEGIPDVDFSRAHDAYWSPSSARGPAAFDRALARCELRFPEDSTRAAARTDDQWRYQYQYLVHTFLPCVRLAGASVHPLESESAYLAEARRFVAPPAFDLVSSPSGSRAREMLARMCAPEAPGLTESADR